MTEDARDELGRSGLLAYCGYAMPLTALSAVVVNLVPPFYAEVLGLPLAAIGAVFFSLRIFDALTDPAMGWLIDRGPFRQRHKPWIVLALPLFLLGIGALFFPPEDAATRTYLFGSGFVVYSAYTIGLVTHQAWGAALARGPESLSKIFGYREVAVIVGIMGAFVAPAIAEAMGYSGIQSKVVAASLFVMPVFVVGTLVALALVPDERILQSAGPDPLDASRGADVSPPLVAEPEGASQATTTASFLRGRHFLLLSLANLAQSFAMVTLSVLSFFLAAYAFGEGDRYAVAIVCYFVSAGAAMPMWMWVARRFGQRAALVVSSCYAITVLLSLPLWIGRMPLIAYLAVLGVAFGAAPYLVRAMIGELAHDFEVSTGRSVRGAAYAVATFFDKLGSGVAAGLALPLVEWLGFSIGPGAGGVDALIAVASGLPALGFGIICCAVFGMGRRRSA